MHYRLAGEGKWTRLEGLGSVVLRDMFHHDSHMSRTVDENRCTAQACIAPHLAATATEFIIQGARENALVYRKLG